MALTRLLPSTGNVTNDQVRLAVCYLVYVLKDPPIDITALHFILRASKGLHLTLGDFTDILFNLQLSKIIKLDHSLLSMNEDFRKRIDDIKLNQRRNEQQAKATT